MSLLRLLIAATLAISLAACAEMTGPPPPGVGYADFRPSDFDWSKANGRNTIAGRLAYHQGPVRFTCSGISVVLTPETPWSRQRIMVLYKSAERSALPADEVRARTSSAPPGDPTPFVRRDTCDGSNQFSFAGLPDGAWYVITVAKPVSGDGESIALMRRVVTRGGRVTPVAL